MIPIEERYRQQVDLLVRTLPSVAAEPIFALKGGTAISLFIRDLLRFSVDIDLTYLPLKPRDEALAEIDDALMLITEPSRRQRQRSVPSRSYPSSGATSVNGLDLTSSASRRNP